MPFIAANRETGLRVTLAAMLVFGAAVLFTAALVPRPRLHALLAARAPDGQVSAEYVDAFRSRSLACAIGLGAVAMLAMVRAGGGQTILPVRTDTIVCPPPVVPLIIVTLIGAAARALLLTRPLHYDEAFTLTEYVSRSPLFFLTRYTHPNNHVLHTLLAWLTTRAGDALWLARLPAFLAGVAIVPATYLIAAREDHRAGWIAAGLSAGATPLVEYAAQARGYTIVVLCVVLLYALRPRPLAGGLLIAAGAWTIPVMAYAAAAYLAWRFLDDRGNAVRTGIVAAAATFVLYVPIVVVSGVDSIFANGNVLPVPYAVLFSELPRSLAVMWREWNLSFTWLGGIALALAALSQRRFALPLLVAVGVIGAMLLLTRRVPFPRVWIFLLPLFLVAAAHGLARVMSVRVAGWVAVAVAAVTAANAVRLTGRDSFFEDRAFAHVRAIAAFVAPAEDALLVVGPLDAPLAYELRSARVPASRVIIHRFDSDPHATRAAVAATPRLRAIVSDAPEGQRQWQALALPHARALRRFDGVTVYEVRP